MKTVKRHCKKCRKETPHDAFREQQGFERGVFVVMTCGASELMNGYVFECQICDERTEK